MAVKGNSGEVPERQKLRENNLHVGIVELLLELNLAGLEARLTAELLVIGVVAQARTNDELAVGARLEIGAVGIARNA